MNNKRLLLILLSILLLSCLSGCQEQQNNNGNQTNNSTNGNQNNKTINRFLGTWEAVDVAPEYESWTFYANHTVENYLIQIFEEQPLPSTSWYNYSYDDTTLCFTKGSLPSSADYFSICYTYEFTQNATRLTLSSNNIIIIDLQKMMPE